MTQLTSEQIYANLSINNRKEAINLLTPLAQSVCGDATWLKLLTDGELATVIAVAKHNHRHGQGQLAFALSPYMTFCQE